MTTGEKAKAKTGAEQGTKEAQEAEAKEVTPKEAEVKEPSVTLKPEDSEGKAKKGEETLEQQHKTLQGMYNKSLEEIAKLKQQGTDFTGVNQKLDEVVSHVSQLGETLSLHTEILSAGAEYNEDIQQKLKTTKEKHEAEQKKMAGQRETIGRMGEIAQIADVQPNDEVLKPAWDALQRGEHEQALRLTSIAVKTKVSAVDFAGKSSEEKKEEEKPDKNKLKQITTTTTSGANWRDLPSKEKIQGAIADRDKD